MQFKNCPKCGQALFDDAAECPICRISADQESGSPMQQEPVHNTDASDSALLVAALAPGAAPDASLDPSTGERHTAPHAVGTTSKAPDIVKILQTAVPVHKNRTTNRDRSVVCPNCDSPGFVESETRRQPVRCWNSNCQVPLFVLRPAGEQGPRSSAAPGMLPIAAAIILVAGLGAGWWLWKGGKNSAPVTVVAKEKSPAAEASASPTVPTPVLPRAVVVPRNVADLRTAAYAALLENLKNLPPSALASGRRLAGTSAVAAGEFADAQEQFAELRRNAVLAPYKFEAVLPITRMAWKRLKVNDDAAFAEALSAALQASRNLPAHNHASSQSVIALGALLAVAGRMPEAHRIVSEQGAGLELDNLAGALEIVSHDGTFNLDQSFPGQTTGRWERPLSTTVAYLLMVNGQNRVAREWAQSDPDDLAKAEGTLLWATVTAERALASKRQPALDEAVAEVAKLPAAAQACFHARLAVLYPSYEKPSEAAEALRTAQALLNAATASPAVSVNSVKELLKLEVPKNTASAQLAARAAAEIAVAQISQGQLDAAGTSLQSALVHYRALGPSSVALQSLEKSVLDQGDRVARDRLRNLFQLTDDRSAETALTNLQKKIAELRPAAEFRLRQQEKLLLAALEWGLLNPAWKEIKSRSNTSNPNDSEDFPRTALPALLSRRFQSAGRSEQRKEIEQLLLASQLQPASGIERLPDNPAPVIQETTNQLIIEGKVTEAAKIINENLRDNAILHRWTLRSACWLAQAGKFDAAVEFLSTISDTAIREEGLRLVSALAAVKHSTTGVFEAAGKRKNQPTEAIAIYCGLLEGLARRPPTLAPSPAANPATATANQSSLGKAPGKGQAQAKNG